MPPLNSRLVTRLIAVALVVVLNPGCGSPPVEPARQGAPSPSPTPTGTATVTNVQRGPMTADELLWLDAVERLLPKMNKVFEESPTDLTPSVLRRLANGAHGCSRELARIGPPPSTRLRPVQTQVQQACLEYDRGAACFTAAADLGQPSTSAAVRKLQQHIECGFAASGKGGAPLAEAQIEAARVKAAAG
jgi:hypothetical protein